MPTPPLSIEAQVLKGARQNGAALIDRLERATVPGEPVDEVRRRVTAAVDGYSDATLQELIAVVQPLSHSDTAWVRDRYLELMLELATAACDVVKDSATRHAVAQSVQCTVLQHEQQLRTVLESAVRPEH